MKEKIFGNKLSILKIIQYTYLSLFLNIIPIIAVYILYTFISFFLKINYIFLMPLIYIGITIILEYRYNKFEIGPNILSSYFLLIIFMRMGMILLSIFSILSTSIIVRKSKFSNNLIIIQEIFRKNFFTILIVNIIITIITSIIISIIFNSYFIYIGETDLTLKKIFNVLIKYKEYIFSSRIVLSSITNYIMYKNFEKNDIIEGV